MCNAFKTTLSAATRASITRTVPCRGVQVVERVRPRKLSVKSISSPIPLSFSIAAKCAPCARNLNLFRGTQGTADRPRIYLVVEYTAYQRRDLPWAKLPVPRWQELPALPLVRARAQSRVLGEGYNHDAAQYNNKNLNIIRGRASTAKGELRHVGSGLAAVKMCACV